MRVLKPHTVDTPDFAIPIETADAVARAAHLWIRTLAVTESRDAGEQRSLAAGLLAGLCERLSLEPHVLALVSYAYSLMNGDGSRALVLSRSMLGRPAGQPDRDAFERGRSEAAIIVEMLAYDGDKM